MMATKNQILVKGVAAVIFGSNSFVFLTTLVIMTPDPTGHINYILFAGILFFPVCVFLYGLLCIGETFKKEVVKDEV